MSHLNTIADDLQAARLERHLSVADAGEAAGISRRTWQGWEQGRDLPLAPALILAGFRAVAPRRKVPKGPQPGRPPRTR